jgi:hypothetical protein
MRSENEGGKKRGSETPAFLSQTAIIHVPAITTRGVNQGNREVLSLVEELGGKRIASQTKRRTNIETASVSSIEIL